MVNRNNIVMKNHCFLLFACVLFSVLSLTACSNDEGPLQNIVIISQRYNEADVRNGELLSLSYYSEFATKVEVVIKDGDNVNVLQHEVVDINRGDGVLSVKIDVGRYYGRAIVYISYPNLYEKKLFSEAKRDITERFFVNILEVEDEPRPEDEIN